MQYSSALRLLFALLILAPSLSLKANAAWPWTKYEGSPRIDPIGPVGNRLPESYRRQYNRPTYLGGKIAAKIAPSSQEAMSFHRSETLGLYDHTGIKGWLNGKNCPPQRVEQHYFYPKPWEVLAVGPRRDVTAASRSELTNEKSTDGKPTDEKSFQELLNHDAPHSLDSSRILDLGNGPEVMELPAPQPEADAVPNPR